MCFTAVNRGSEQVRFLLFSFFPGVRRGRKNSGLCCEAIVPNFSLEECLSSEKKLTEKACNDVLLVTTRG